MIIVSQDKKSIYNFDNAKSIDILDNGIYITDNILADEGTLIGVYETEERANEVLEEIIRKLEDVDIVNLMENLQISLHDPNFGGNLASVYRMPKE